jgi:two-component system nitrogen regulation sensor histidine kinase GlnL
MILINLILLFTVIADLGLGVTVFLTNRLRKANQAYLIATTLMFFWLIANLFILHSTTSKHAMISIRTACSISICIPSSFQLLRLSIKYPNSSWFALLRKSSVQIGFNIIISASCFLPSFLKAVRLPEPGSSDLVQPEYGAPFVFLVLYFVCAICALAFTVTQDRKKLQGTQRLELEFLVLAGLTGIILGVFGTFLAIFSDSSSTVPITNAASVITISLIVAYGITMHRILTVSFLLRKATAYVLMTGYLSVVYYAAWLVSQGLLNLFSVASTFPSHLISTLAVAFSMLPARQRMQQATDLLFSNASTFDVQTTVKKAGTIFQSVTTINALLQQFSELLKESIGAKKISILTYRDDIFIQSYPRVDSTGEKSFSSTDAIIQRIRNTKDPVSRDSLDRIRSTPSTQAAIQQLSKYSISIATGIFSKGELIGLVLLGARKGGRIYDKNEQDALQILCNQFAVALDNAQMYTEMQDSKIRNEIMLDQLVSGVIVANPDRKIALINHEAQRITGLTGGQGMDQEINLLPQPITQALETTLATKVGVRIVDAALFAQEEESTHVRMGSAYLIGHDDKPMGALLVFTDMTELKKLEEQVRRTDQLSSVGTLAAGMAHEIKNPLVTIKTFTQLLPERHADKEFREDFSSLVAHEVSRIDGIVNQLLSFSKPTTPHLVPMNLHNTIEHTLKLIQEQLSQKNIVLNSKCRAKHDQISGDADLLTQAFVNLNLNALDAIESDGVIKVRTTNCTYRFVNGDDPEKASAVSCIRLQISDTGKGIAQDQLQKIFDPFFTSKSEGTGMGLSVAHGIIQEHHGVIEVESEPGKGTTFYIYLPVLKGDAVA